MQNRGPEWLSAPQSAALAAPFTQGSLSQTGNIAKIRPVIEPQVGFNFLQTPAESDDVSINYKFSSFMNAITPADQPWHKLCRNPT